MTTNSRTFCSGKAITTSVRFNFVASWRDRFRGLVGADLKGQTLEWAHCALLVLESLRLNRNRWSGFVLGTDLKDLKKHSEN